MTLTQLRSFHAVASSGGFVAGASALNVSQPTLTAQIKALEAEFGVELFYRRNRRSQLTPSGRDLHAITQRLFAEEKEARELLSAAKGLHTGHLRIGAVGPYHVTEMLAAFNQRYPGITLSMSIGNSSEVQRDLLDYKSDVAVLAHIDPDERLIAIPYRRHPVLVFMQANHKLARRKSIRLGEVAGEPFVARESGSTTRRAFEDAAKAKGVQLRTIIEIGSREAIREAVIRGIGMGYVSEAEFIPDARLRAVRVKDAGIYTAAHVVFLREREHGRLIKAFLDVVRGTAQRSAAPFPGATSAASKTRPAAVRARLSRDPA
jgi:LysR family transcriptional regulator, low CO2-responsive transcriptional regulator